MSVTYITRDGSLRIGELRKAPVLRRSGLALAFVGATRQMILGADASIQSVFVGPKGWTLRKRQWQPLVQKGARWIVARA